MSKVQKAIAIIGGGPAGATLSFLLARDGYRVGLFHNDRRPPLIVGESLLPAVIPILRTLGIEDEVKSFSIFKPGATVCLKVDEVISASFTFAKGKLPDYAYNTPRDRFDAAVLGAAERAGTTVFQFSARLEKGDEADTVRLSHETLEKTAGFFGKAPHLIVDASGRSRLISRLLDIPIEEGPRKDVALFAHLSTAIINDPGHIHLDYLTRGWSWRIPLPGRVSLGIVVNPTHLEQYGPGIEKQFDGFLSDESSLKHYCRGASRLTPVVKYNNYQIIPTRMFGNGWAMIGDAAGFLDPIFSSGLYLGMKGAGELYKAIANETAEAMLKYQEGRHREFKLWEQVIESWYNGRLFNLYRAGQKYRNYPGGAIMERRVRKRVARILTGEAASDVYSMKLFQYLISLGAVLRNPDDLIVN